jgi:purine-binding chemotaxis protein CheW
VEFISNSKAFSLVKIQTLFKILELKLFFKLLFMNEQSYLTFRSHNLIYGLEISLVEEIFYLPELTIIPETPGDIIGVLYLRNRTIPVMHLDRRLGKPIQECRISDRVIVIQWQNIEMGVIVNEVLDVIDIERRFLEPEPNYGRENYLNTAFIAYLATFAEQSIVLLNSEALIRQPDLVMQFLEDTEIADRPTDLSNNFFDLYCPHVTAKEKKLFRQRTQELQKPLEAWEAEGTMPLAVFSLEKEYFGCDLALVKEFIDIDKITPIPSCPNHIIGNINLRGEIITLVDIRSILNFAKAETSGTQAILVQIEEMIAGIVVDEIFDVLCLDREQLMPNPTGVAAKIQPFFQGMTMYEQKLLSAIDLAKIFAEANLLAS